MEKIVKIEGISCEHCVKRIEKTLQELNDIIKVKVNLKNSEFILKLDNDIDDKLLKKVIEELGYIVKKIKKV